MFNCDKCGLCCRNLQGEIFKDFHNGDGICKRLDRRTNRCRIYNERPIFCNVDRAFEAYFKEKITREKYYEMNYKACEILKNEGGN